MTRFSPRVLGRGLGLAVLAPISWQVVARGVTPSEPGLVLRILDGANLIFHEAGHVFFMFFGEFLHALGGSVMQVAIPAACAAYFLSHGQPGGASAALLWTGESLTNVAVYLADARRMELPLIGGEHDWNYILGRLSLLDQAERLGWLVFGLGLVTIQAALALLTADLIRAWTESAAA